MFIVVYLELKYEDVKSRIINMTSIQSRADVNAALSQIVKCDDGIYGSVVANGGQQVEIKMREKVAAARHTDPLAHIARHHSVPVMDFEVSRYLSMIPKGGLILDIGGCWGWHWRNLQTVRPDLIVVIVDFVRGNLLHAQTLLGDVINESVFLVHGDATALNFPDGVFDGVWTVQTFQHIPAFEKAVAEAHRVLKKGGVFANYSLNVQPHIKGIKRIFGKEYPTSGWVAGSFWLARASLQQKRQIEAIFGSKVRERWSEILYSPELRFPAPGREGSYLGKFDALLSNDAGFLRWLARQHTFLCQKT